MTYKKTSNFGVKFYCEFCDFECFKKGDYNRHVSTDKHKNRANTYPKNIITSDHKLYFCECGKKYKHNQSLYNHKKKCFSNIDIFTNNDCKNLDISKNNLVTQETIMHLVNENNDIKNLLIEQQKQIVEQQKQIGELIPRVGNTINNTSNIKQNFNINIFLNEQCKDALNMEDFIKQIQLTLDNLEVSKNTGLVEGISNIFIENMNKLSIYERPMHCTDLKRETLYIKDNDNWEKDIDKTKIKTAIKNINKNHYTLIQEWVNENPDFNDVEEKQTYFIQLLRTCGANLESLNDKVIKKLCISTNLKNKIKKIDENLIV
jgi:hypothetical protein